MATATVEQRNRDIVVGAIEAVKGGDADTFMAVLDPQVKIHEPPNLPYGGLYEGRESFLQIYEQVIKLADPTQIELISATADAERAVLLMTIPLLSGERFYVTEHWCLTNGLVTDVRVFWFEIPDFEQH
jgi:hypothetical protein